VGTIAVPVLAQLGLVFARPFKNESKPARRKPAVDQLQGVDRDLGDVLAVLRMEVRGGWSLKYIVLTMP
jgi:hypothetical protein